MRETSSNAMDAALRGVPTAPTRWDAVKTMAKAGFSILLVKPGTKDPLDVRSDREKANDEKAGRSGSGLHTATTNLDRLEKYWARAVEKFGVEPNVAVNVERSGLVVIDADQADETADVQRRGLEEADVPLEAYAPTVTTPGAKDAAGKWVHSGGGHFHFYVDVEDLPLVKSFKLPGGAEVSAKDRYVLVPPSVRDEGPYTVTGRLRPLSSAPWLIDLIRARAETDEADTAARAQAAADRAQRRETEGPSSVEAWNDAHGWEELLTAYDWTPTGKPDNCGCPVVTAPGDHASPKSATAHEDGCTNRRVDLEGASGPLHIWTDHPPVELEGRERWTKAQFVAAMRHQTMEEFLEDQGLVDDEVDPAALVLEVDEATEEWFWSRHENLEAIRTYARLHRASPWGTLGAVLAIVAAAVPPYVTLPALVGGRAPLNTFVALVASSGGGKGTSTRAAYGVLAGLPAIPSNEAGSGEGLVKAYGFRNRKLDDTNTYRVTDTFLVDVPEVDSLYSVSGRLGATISASLRKAWSGEALGFQYADTTKAAMIPAMAYRLAAIVGVQPRRADRLLNEHTGGLPQRFVFFPTNDPGFTKADRVALRQAMGGSVPRVDVSYIARLFPPLDPFRVEVQEGGDKDDKPPVTVAVWRPLAEHEYHDVKVGPAAEDAVDDDSEARLSSSIDADVEEDDELGGHRNLLRLKTAAVLSVLIGEGGDVSDEVWEMAGVVLAKSDETVGLVRKVLRKADRKLAEAKGKALAAQASVIREVESREAQSFHDQARAKILAALKGGEWVGHTDLRNMFRHGPRREAFVEVLAELMEEGVVEDGKDPKQVRRRVLRLTTEASS